jgi:hypothetical protein
LLLDLITCMPYLGSKLESIAIVLIDWES